MADHSASTFYLTRSNSYFARTVSMTWHGSWTASATFSAGFGGAALLPYQAGGVPPIAWGTTEFSSGLVKRGEQRFYTEPLAAQSVGGTMTLIVGVKENTASANIFLRVHAYLTVGDTDVVRAVLSTYEDTSQEFPITATFQSHAITLTTQAAQAGDRLCLEIGWHNDTVGSATPSIYTGAIADDAARSPLPAATVGSTNVTTEAGTVTFSTPLTLQGAGLVDGDLVVGNGDFAVYSSSGALKPNVHYVPAGTGSAGGYHDVESGVIWGTNENLERVFTFDTDLQLLGTFDVAAPIEKIHVIVPLADGTVWVGANGDTDNGTCITDAGGPSAAGTGPIVHLDADGTQLGVVDPTKDLGGVPSMSLAGDQVTMFYGSLGLTVRTVNLETSAESVFATIPSGTVRGMKVLPDGGLLVACELDIRRFDADGGLVQTYTLSEQSDWGTIALAPDGLSFWSANTGANEGGGVPTICRFDLETGELLTQIFTPISFDLTGGASMLCSGGIVAIGAAAPGTSTPEPPADCPPLITPIGCWSPARTPLGCGPGTRTATGCWTGQVPAAATRITRQDAE